MSQRQANIFIKRFEKLQRWEQGNWIVINLVFTCLSLYAKITHQPTILWILAVLVLFTGPTIYREYQKKQRLLLQNNIVNLPADWDKRLSIFTRLAGWNLILVLCFGLTYFLPNLSAYIAIGVLYAASWWIGWKTSQKRKEVRNYLFSV